MEKSFIIPNILPKDHYNYANQILRQPNSQTHSSPENYATLYRPNSRTDNDHQCPFRKSSIVEGITWSSQLYHMKQLVEWPIFSKPLNYKLLGIVFTFLFFLQDQHCLLQIKMGYAMEHKALWKMWQNFMTYYQPNINHPNWLLHHVYWVLSSSHHISK